MRVGAEWTYSREGWDDLPEGVDDPGWLATGAIIGDVGGLILLIALVLGASACTGSGRGRAPGCSGPR